MIDITGRRIAPGSVVAYATGTRDAELKLAVVRYIDGHYSRTSQIHMVPLNTPHGEGRWYKWKRRAVLIEDGHLSSTQLNAANAIRERLGL